MRALSWSCTYCGAHAAGSTGQAARAALMLALDHVRNVHESDGDPHIVELWYRGRRSASSVDVWLDSSGIHAIGGDRELADIVIREGNTQL